MAEKMTNEREAFEKWASEYGFTKFDKTSTGAYKTFVSRALFDSFRAGVNHLAQPAQAVDVGALKTLLELVEDEHGGDHAEADCRYCAAADKLTRAIGNAQADD